MKLSARLRKPLTVFIHDLLMVPIAWLGAYWLRFNLEAVPGEYLREALDWLPVIMIVQALVFVYLGLYRGDWRFASLPDLMRIIKAVAVGMLLCVAIIFLFTRLQNIPRSIFPMYSFLLIGGLGGSRFLYRWLKDHKLYLGQGQRVLIAGAGRAGEMLARDLLRDPEHSLQPVGFVDDRRLMRGTDIHGIRVLGPCKKIPRLVEKHDIELILLAVPSANSPQLRRIVEYCEQAGVPFRMLPRLQDLVAGRVSIDTLREVSIEDLLGRDAVSLDYEAIKSGMGGKTVLVTGGGGSIGSELSRQVARLGPARLVLFENSEYSLYAIEKELRRDYPDLELHPLLGDVTDSRAVDKLFRTCKPEIVLHAAAYKHVPLLENQIREAVRNNVLGTQVMAMAADRYGCDAFVLISTDKAVNPANIMGASKRLAEIFCQNFNQRSESRFITVRFGNVLGSAGSVVPLFKEQIEAGGPVTVTHPDMIRYFMTIPEACLLILQAEVMGQGGEIYVLDMGEPVNITYLAEQMIHLAGREPGKDIKIVYTGLRPGEKLAEELFHKNEHLSSTQHKQIFLAHHRSHEWKQLDRVYRELDTACREYNEVKLRKAMQYLVPEMHHSPVELPDNVVKLEQRRHL